MNKLIALAFIASFAFIASGTGVYAQWMVPVVSACAGQSYTAGQNRVLTQDTTGDLCTNASGGGGGGGAVTLASGAVASGAYSAGAFVSGSVVAGAFSTGAISDLYSATAPVPYAGTGTATAITELEGIRQGVLGSIAAGTNSIGNVTVSPYPATAVPITASATGTTGATTATLTNVSGHTTYICGFSIRANATAAATNNATVTGTISATMNFTQWTAPLASGLGVTEEVFSPCIPASAVSTSIAVISGAPGSGGVVSVTAWGYSI